MIDYNSLSLETRVARMEALNDIQNLIALYVNLHSASRQQETCDLFCKKTPGVILIFNGDIYDGYEGVEKHFLGRMAQGEQDLSGGRLYAHDVLTPYIQVAADAQSAKCVFSTHGAETGAFIGGKLRSLWSWAKYRFDVVKEDGEWKIYRLELHQTFLTPYDGEGWTEDPNYDMLATLPPMPEDFVMIGADRVTKVPYKPLSLESADCDIHNMIPELPAPYETYDFTPLDV